MKMNGKFNIFIRIIKDRLFLVTLLLLALTAVTPLFILLFKIIKQGFQVINWDFIFNLPKPIGEKGSGIVNAIVGTVLLIFLASVISVFIAILAGIYLYENKNTQLYKWIRLSAETMQGIPSIIYGLIAYLWIVKPMGNFSALSGGIALGFIMLPIIAISTEETLSMIPHSLKEAALALGISYPRTIQKVILPIGIKGVLTGILLSIARIAGETAPLLFTAFGNPYMNVNIFKPINSLPHVIFTYTSSPYQEWQAAAWGTSFILILMILLLNLLAKIGARRWKITF